MASSNKKSIARSGFIVNIVLVLFLLLVLVIASSRIIRGLMRQVKSLFSTMAAVRDKSDLRVRAETISNDELGEIAGALNLTLDKFSGAVKPDIKYQYSSGFHC